MDLNRRRNRILPFVLVGLVILLAGRYQLGGGPNTPRRDFETAFPRPQWTSDHPNYHSRHLVENEWKIRRIAACVEANNCPPHRDEVIIMASWHCHVARYAGYRGGEGVWCLAIVDWLERAGYTLLWVSDDYEEARRLHLQIPDLTKMVIGGGEQRAKDVFKTKEDPSGIPAWKHIDFYYFPTQDRSPISDAWIICAEPEAFEPGRDFTYIGYPLVCNTSQVVPYEKRSNRVWVLTKRLQYFYSVDPAWEPSFFRRAHDVLSKEFPDFEFVAAYVDDRSEEQKKKNPEWVAVDGVRNLGSLNADQFQQEVAASRTMLGIGSPGLSPSPHIALCMGVSFINPFVLPGFGTMEDRRSWRFAQHATMMRLDPPFVWHARRFVFEEFLQAIRESLQTPTPSYQWPHMTLEAFEERMHKLTSRNLSAEAEVIFQQASGDNTDDPRRKYWVL